MNIPKKVKIGPHTYIVKYEKDLSENHNAIGQSRHTKGTIILDPEQSDSQLEDTFLHEILHAVDQQIQFAPVDKTENENVIARLAPALLNVLKENKLLK